MESLHHIAPRRRPNATFARRPAGAVALIAAPLLVLALGGCGSSARSSHSERMLLTGTGQDAIASRQLAPAAGLAQRFATAYARGVYHRRPAHLPGVTTALKRDLSAAAAKVPPTRRGLHPRALSVMLEPRSANSLAATVRIGDGHSPPFSVGFLVERRRAGWRVVSISPPG